MHQRRQKGKISSGKSVSLPVKGGGQEAPRGKERSRKADARPAEVLPPQTREEGAEAAAHEKGRHKDGIDAARRPRDLRERSALAAQLLALRADVNED